MTTFKIVFTFDVFFSAEITCTADVLHSYLVFSIGTRFVDPLFLFHHFCGTFSLFNTVYNENVQQK